MSRATLSLLGLYQYDNTIFDELVLPEGMDKQLYINNLLMETAELEVLFSNPATMRSVIGIWSSAHLDSWSKMWNTTKLEYNPIENYDRQEDWTDNNKTNSKVQSTDKGIGKITVPISARQQDLTVETLLLVDKMTTTALTRVHRRVIARATATKS